MSDTVVSPPPEASATRSRRGQSLVEFALVLPMLLVLLLGLADFGRAFAAGIAIEAAARNAAEIVAQEYLRNPPGPLTPPSYYDPLHATASRVACGEARVLPNTTFSAGSCPAWPVIRSCIHDGRDPACGRPVSGFAPTVPPQCTYTDGNASPDAVSDPPWDPAQRGGTDETSRYVEVRICYRFTTLLDLSNLRLPFGWGINIGEIHLSSNAVFTVADY